MTRKLVDPVHFFASDGHSIMTRAYLLARIKILEDQNARLKKVVKKMAAAQERPADEPSPTLN